jgi:hypothetical protein
MGSIWMPAATTPHQLFATHHDVAFLIPSQLTSAKSRGVSSTHIYPSISTSL